MSSPAPAEVAGQRSAGALRPLHQRLLLVLWPAFVMAGVLEALVFFVIDPGSLSWYGVEPIEWSRNAVYSVTFLIFWGVIATSGAISLLLDAPGN